MSYRVLMQLEGLDSTQEVRVVVGYALINQNCTPIRSSLNLLYVGPPCAQAATTGSVCHNLMCFYYFAGC